MLARWPAWASPLLFVVLLLVVGRLGNGGVHPTAVEGRQLLGEHLENVTFTGTLVGRSPSKHGVGTTLQLETTEGYVLVVYLSPDVPPQPLRLGDRLQLVGSTSQPGVIAVTRPDGLKRLPTVTASTRLHHVATHGDTALVSVGDHQVRVPLPPGQGRGHDFTLTTTSAGASYLDPDD